MFSTMSLVLCLMVAGASAQVTTFQGACPDVTVQQNFNVAQFLGKWYEYKHSPYLSFFNDDSMCITNYIEDNNNGSLTLRTSQFNKKSKSEESLVGSAIPSASGEGKLLVQFPGLETTSVVTRERVPSAETVAAAESVLAANKVATELHVNDHSSCPGDAGFDRTIAELGTS